MFTGREYLGTIQLYDYRNRTYSPKWGRFIEVDPIRFEGRDLNLYRYVRNWVMELIDPLGLDPGCILPTQHAAVIDALETFIPFSKEENREYVAVICHSKEGYWVSNPIYGEEGAAFVSHEELKELVFNFCPENSQTVGYVHTHGSSKMELYEGSLEIFSSADINYAKQYGLDGYLGTPEGSIQYYDFSEDTCQCISQ